MTSENKLAFKNIVQGVTIQEELRNKVCELLKKKDWLEDIGMKMEIPALLFEVNKMLNRADWASLRLNVWMDKYLEKEKIKFHCN